MVLLNRIRQMSVGQLWRVFLLFVQRPGMIWPTYRATRNTLAISQRLYGKSHKGSGAPNAFRHALWNCLLAGESLKRQGDAQQAVEWARKVTDLHENLAVNDPLNRAMDQHNNAVGRNHFLSQNGKKTQEFIETLQEMTKNAQKAAVLSDFKKWPDKLVYI